MLAPPREQEMLRKLEKYEIHEEIGHGGMATVYRAHDTVLDRMVALKVMHPHLRGAEEARKRFQREARSVARLRHPRVLEIYDFSGEGSQEAYIAAELLTGPTLKRWREDHQGVPAEIAACFAIEICGALAAAHEAGIVHRDVKPENVLLHEDRTIKLTDFGIADMMDAASMTATGQILGSPGHMAPEQIEGKQTDTRTDLFSLGTVLYYLATGRLPFTGRNPHQVLKRIMDGEYADPLRVNPTLGGRMREIIVKSLERDADARYQTADELRATLEEFVAEAGIEDSEALLARYLQDPEGVRAEVNAQTVEHLIVIGSGASDAGDVPRALDCYNRVLAIDDGNERVLRLIERVGMDRRRRVVTWIAGGLVAFGALAGGAAWALWPDAEVGREPTVPPIAAGASEEPDASDGPEADAGAIAPEAGDPEDAGAPAAPDAALAVAEADAGRERPGRAPTRAVPRSRTVRFVSHQANLLISVDGAPPRPISEFRTAELSVGPEHQIEVTPDAQAREQGYEARVQREHVPAGDSEHEIRVSLGVQDARLYVDTGSVSATVDVHGRVVGRSNDLITVPMRLREELLTLRVSAPGYRSTDRSVRLIGGAATRQESVSLEAE